jgi:hypothetical protein
MKTAKLLPDYLRAKTATERLKDGRYRSVIVVGSVITIKYWQTAEAFLEWRKNVNSKRG